MLGQPTARLLARITGQTPSLTDDALAAMGRVILEVVVERVYGVSYVPDA